MIKFGIFLFPISLIIAKVANHIINNPRPFVVENFTPLISHAADNGFPSDHVLLVSALAAVVTPFSRKWSLVLWFITIFVAISRVETGVHHAADVIGSIIISILVAGMIYFFSKNKSNAADSNPEYK
ncbi:phosphatase PAP2 family protein [Candidatus Parcubacteria bacterium]|nr:phosphatase PAP2 family protein [Candidatus Parcubacteria bacterium]